MGNTVKKKNLADLPVHTLIMSKDRGMFLKIRKHDEKEYWIEVFVSPYFIPAMFSAERGKKSEVYERVSGTWQKYTAKAYFGEFKVLALPIET